MRTPLAGVETGGRFRPTREGALTDAGAVRRLVARRCRDAAAHPGAAPAADPRSRSGHRGVGAAPPAAAGGGGAPLAHPVRRERRHRDGEPRDGVRLADLQRASGDARCRHRGAAADARRRTARQDARGGVRLPHAATHPKPAQPCAHTGRQLQRIGRRGGCRHGAFHRRHADPWVGAASRIVLRRDRLQADLRPPADRGGAPRRPEPRHARPLHAHPRRHAAPLGRDGPAGWRRGRGHPGCARAAAGRRAPDGPDVQRGGGPSARGAVRRAAGRPDLDAGRDAPRKPRRRVLRGGARARGALPRVRRSADGRGRHGARGAAAFRRRATRRRLPSSASAAPPSRRSSTPRR